MTAQVTQSFTQAGTTPTPLTPAATDTFALSQFGPNGIVLRVITTGTATTVTVADPNVTAMGNTATPPGVTCPSSGARMIQVPLSAYNSAAGSASVAFSGALTGVTYEAYRY